MNAKKVREKYLEEPLYIVLYESSNRAMIQSTQEPPGEEES